MPSTLLATKTRIPPRRPHLTPRSRLNEILDRAIPYAKLGLIAAPAGYGKTTLLCQWAHASRLPVAWLSLEQGDNDIERFLRYLVTAWDDVHPGIKETTVGLLLGSTSLDIDSILSAFINVGSEQGDQTVFVLDDFHVVADRSVHHALSFLIDHLPPALHFVLASRGQPPLPLSRYRARGELLELNIDDLRFRPEETRAFLNQQLPGRVSDETTATLQVQLDGWAAGLQLACHAIRHRSKAAGLPSLSGTQRFIADYLSEEILGDLDPATRQFLLQTSVLEQLSGELCDAVTERSNSQRMLETLEREGLFLAPLDDRREWFRYDPLFAGVLREELHRRYPQDVASFHCRAAIWHLGHAMPEQAFNHAVAGNDVDLATRIGHDYAVIKLESGELNVVARWLQMIPQDWFACHPLIDLLRAAFLIYTGALDESIQLLDDIERRMKRSHIPNRREQLALVATVRCAIACFQNDVPSAEAYAAAALADLPSDECFYRSSIYHALGDTYCRNAHWDQAKDAYRAALQVVHQPSFRIRSVHIFGALADLELRQGHLQQAGDYWGNAIAAIQERELWGRLPMPVIGWIYIRMGELLYERNRLHEASHQLARGLQLAQLGGDLRSLIAGNLLAARLSLTEREIDRASAHLERTRLLLEQASLPEWRSRFKRCQLELWLALGQPPAVDRWIDSMTTAGEAPPDEAAIDQLTLARALLAKERHRDRERTFDILLRLIAVTARHGRTGLQIEALAVQALARRADGDRPGALISLERSLRLAEPEGFVRVFADLGLPMARLLQEAQARGVMPAYVSNLLDAFTAGGAPSEGRPASPIEPLSEREQDVLALIAAGLTNQEIGEKLFIARETVKKHTQSIYAKLNVDRRTRAVARARELGILSESR